MDVPVQYFQSVIAIELAVVGALLFEIRFFERSPRAEGGDNRTDPRVLLVLAAVLAATVFGSLAAMRHEGGALAASAVTVGLAISVVPILLRVLPPIAREATTGKRDPHVAYTVAGLVVYALVVAGAVALLNT
jgi:hypothetical protein